MSKTGDLTVAILKEIRDSAKQTNDKLDLVTERLERLERAQVASETRLATELVAVVGAIQSLQQLFFSAVSPKRVAELEGRIAELERKVS